MIVTKNVSFTPGGVGTVSHNQPFKIIDCAINTPSFGDLKLYLFTNESEERGIYFGNYCIAPLEKEIPDFVSIEGWESVCKIVDSGHREYFLLVSK